MKKSYTHKGIDYEYPEVHILAENGIGQSEFGARSCYNSHDKSENYSIINLKTALENEDENQIQIEIEELKTIECSPLLEQLSFVHFHESTLEHSVLTYYLSGFSRGVLQELVRTRIASYSVQSTRYTLSNLINVFTTVQLTQGNSKQFVDIVLGYDMLVTAEEGYNRLELHGIYDKLIYQYNKVGQTEWLEMTTAKSIREKITAGLEFNACLDILNSKNKRNVGDAVKHLITDNFKVNAVMTINLRSLKNFLALRDSGAAYFQINKLAKEMKRVTPERYLKLIIKGFKREGTKTQDAMEEMFSS